LNNVSTRPQYHNKECWSCGYDLFEGEVNWMTEKERLDFKADMEVIA